MNSRNERDETELEKRARELFDASVESLDVATRGKLARARARALEHTERQSWATILGAPGYLAAGGVVAAALVAILVWRSAASPDVAVEVAALGDLELLLAEDEFEMLAELEFYAWLEQQPELESLPASDDGVG